MPTLTLNFGVSLEAYFSPFTDYHGPIFHRWLPNGPDDAIELPVTDQDALLRVWFERRGYKEQGFIRYSRERKEVDPADMERQGALDGGPLFGSLVIKNIDASQIDAVTGNKRGDKNYVRLGKRVIRLIETPVIRLLDILRVNYGQYWIRSLPKWDSRRMSMGRYCQAYLQIRWSLDGGHSIGGYFVPNDPSVAPIVLQDGFTSYSSFITRQDWETIRQAIGGGYTPTTAALILANAHQYLDQADLRPALLDGVTALELAVAEFVDHRLPSPSPLRDDASRFTNWQDLSAKFTVVATALGRIGIGDIERSVKAIKLRNAVVHDGYMLSDPDVDLIRTLLLTVSRLLSGPSFKFPRMTSANCSASSEDWENGRIPEAILSTAPAKGSTPPDRGEAGGS